MAGDDQMQVERPGASARARAWARLAAGPPAAALYSTSHVTAAAPHVRDAVNIQRMFFYFVVATLPALLIGLWNLGAQISLGMTQTGVTQLQGPGGSLVAVLGWTPLVAGPGSRLLLGLAYFVPLFAVALTAGLLWECLFAAVTGRRPESGVLMSSWLYALMLPADLPLPFAALGISFGLVFGKHVFGGVGKYIASPALLGVLFLSFSYPMQVGNTAGLPVLGADVHPVLTLFAQGGLEGIEQSGVAWIDVFIGREPGALGTTSAAACAAGALFLVVVGAASLRIVAGALLGLMLGTWLAAALGASTWVPWYWHACLGSFAFGVAFIATDPVAAAVTRAGRWVYGLSIGLLVVLIRTADPSHPDGTLFAILLASLFAPLMDFFVVRVHVCRRQRHRRAERA